MKQPQIIMDASIRTKQGHQREKYKKKTPKNSVSLELFLIADNRLYSPWNHDITKERW